MFLNNAAGAVCGLGAWVPLQPMVYPSSAHGTEDTDTVSYSPYQQGYTPPSPDLLNQPSEIHQINIMDATQQIFR